MGIFAVAPLAGVLLGVLDFLWIKFVPGPFGQLGNSLAVWAAAAFFFAARIRRPPLVSAVTGVLMLVPAVPVYYVAAAVVQHDDWSNVYAGYSFLWMGLAVIAGAFFGLGGALSREPGPLLLPAAALPGAVLFAEAILNLRRYGDPDYRPAEIAGFALVLAVLGLLATFFAASTWRSRLLALLWTVPLAAAGWLALTLTGFH